MTLVILPFFWLVLITLSGGNFITVDMAVFGMSNDDLGIYFGILAVIMAELGLIAAPVGLNVFVIKFFSPNTGIAMIFRGVARLLTIEPVRVSVLVLFPGLTLYLTKVL